MPGRRKGRRWPLRASGLDRIIRLRLSHTELLEVMQPDPFIPAAGTATPFTGLGTYPSGGVTSRPGDWERYQWPMHDN